MSNVNVTISRDSSDWFKIRVQDESSREVVCTVRMTAKDFAFALTGLANVEAVAQFGKLDRVGKVKVQEKRSIICPLPSYASKTELQQWLQANAQKEGWIIDDYLGAQGSLTSSGDGSRLNYSVFKYVDAP